MTVIPMRLGKGKSVDRQRLRSRRVYAIAFDLDCEVAERLCGANFRGACYQKIERVLAEHGFERRQGSLFFGGEDSDAVQCVVAVQDLDRRFHWFGRAVKDLRMLRVDENNDLLPALSNRLRLDESDVA